MKRHTNINGKLDKCDANVRACRYSNQTHAIISDGQIAQLQKIADPRVELPKGSPKYLKLADKEYSDAYKAFAKAKKEYNITKEAESKKAKKTGFSDSITEKNRYHEATNQYLKTLQEAYVEQGIPAWKAKFFAGESLEKGTPYIKTRDKDIKDVKERTTAAVNSDKVKEAHESFLAAKEHHIKAKTFNQTPTQSHQLLLNKINTQEKYQKAKIKRELAVKKFLGGIPDKARAVSFDDIRPSDFSIGKDGKINNVWFQHASTGEYERIVDYKENQLNIEDRTVSSGYLETEKGNEVSRVVHHHSYKRSVVGDGTFFVAPQVGKKNKKNMIFGTSFDSGD